MKESGGSQLAIIAYPEESRRISPVELSLGAEWFGNCKVVQAAVMLNLSGSHRPIIPEMKRTAQRMREKLREKPSLSARKGSRGGNGVTFSGNRPNGRSVGRPGRLTVLGEWGYGVKPYLGR